MPPGATRRILTLTSWEEAIDRVVAGPERKSRIISQREKEITAYHESGHALVGHVLPHQDKVHKISIVARGTMGGYTRYLPEEDRYTWTKSQFKDMLSSLMGGLMTERPCLRRVHHGPGQRHRAGYKYRPTDDHRVRHERRSWGPAPLGVKKR